jgi:outer membrane protein OmpA-like peptidoglycan-associated protein
MRNYGNIIIIFVALVQSSCSVSPGPDKAIAGAVLGGGWGAGAGAIVGNQVAAAGPGAAIGAGFGAAGGLVSGAGFDQLEEASLETREDIDALKMQVAANRGALASVRDDLDSRHDYLRTLAGKPVTVFFDPESALLRSGYILRLETLVESIKANPSVAGVMVYGHSDDTGDASADQKLSQARAETVETFLLNRGVPRNKIATRGWGGMRPIASNDSESGRQLNRRVEVYLSPNSL